MCWKNLHPKECAYSGQPAFQTADTHTSRPFLCIKPVAEEVAEVAVAAAVGVEVAGMAEAEEAVEGVGWEEVAEVEEVVWEEE